MIGKWLYCVKRCDITTTTWRAQDNRRSENKFQLKYNILVISFDHWPLIVGKYYLVDVGYATMNGFIAPHGGIRYHLNEHSGKPPANPKELFNMKDLMLRSRVEWAFTILKDHFKILTSHPFFPFESQVKWVLVCCIIHTYNARVDSNNKTLNEGSTQQQE